jgi:hypothetical protein
MSSKGILPGDPPRADHRFIRYQIKNFVKKKVLDLPEEYDHVSRVFAKAGGSWERLFLGSVQDVVLLRRIIKVAVKTGHISAAPKWR